MKRLGTPLPGVFLIEPERSEDERGFFARMFCAAEFKKWGMNPQIAQCSISFNRYKGTLRGMHYQIEPHAETKLVRCTRGTIYDVALDLRRDSPSYKRWFATELSAESRRMLYIPAGCAHGFQTLADDTEVLYQMNTAHSQDAARGIRWNDPALGISWPLPDPILSVRDRSYPSFGDVDAGAGGPFPGLSEQ